jgi:tRNA 2-thiouridine synthesizing protein A
MHYDMDIDARDLQCPLPVLRLRKKMVDVAPGQTVRLRATDPMAEIDVPHFCAQAGYEFLGQSNAENAQAYFITKPARPSPK